MASEIKWDGEPHPEFEDIIQKEVGELLENGLARASDLIFHHIWLEDDPEGPTIFVCGAEGDEAFHVEYLPSCKMVSAAESEPRL